MLYFKGYVKDFNDLDIMVADSDSYKAEEILKHFGPIQQSTKGSYETKHFREFIVDGADVDMIGGFAIVRDGKVSEQVDYFA